MCLRSDALLQHLPSYLGFSYLGGVSLHSCSSKVQLLLLTLDEGYLLTATHPDLQHGIAPLGPPAPVQPWLLVCGVGPPGHRPYLGGGVLRVPWTARRSNQSILKEISPEYSLEGLMLKLKHRYFGYLMRRTDSFEKP